jgi:ABC-type nitrate/sulfonate/bicarbonate transport system substrate-binding protein
MTDILVSAGIIVLLILFGGLFVASEIALVSLRESQVKGMAGKRGKRVAALASSPNRFLATVQLEVQGPVRPGDPDQGEDDRERHRLACRDVVLKRMCRFTFLGA